MILRLLLRHLASAIPVLLLVSLITFALMRLIPGDPSAAIGGLNATAWQLAQIRADLGLDQSLPVQLLKWYNGLLHGDLGRSLLMGQDVLSLTLQRLPVTIGLSAYALLLTLIFGIGLGLVAALRHNRWADQAAMAVAMLGISLPSFFAGLLLILLFAVHLGWLPSGGYVPFLQSPPGWLRAMTLPAISLALLQLGLLARVTRSTLLEVLGQDYIRTAHAKGLPAHVIVLRHALSNALIPILAVVGIIVSLLISGSVVTEAIFSIPGIGQLLTQAVLNRDYPMVQGGLLMTTALLVAINIAIDLSFALLDPRVRRG